LQGDDNVFELQGTVGFGDLLRFQYFNILRRTWWFVLPLLLFLLVVTVIATVAALMFRSTEIASKGTPFLLLLLFWSGVFAYCPYLAARRLLKTSRVFGQHGVYRFSAETIHFSSADSSGDTSWRALWVVRETKSMFLLYLNEYSAYLLPKRFFSDANEQNAWRRLVEQRILPKVISKPGFIGGRL
jgi:hypothetical protein